ncbi:MAG TPA: AMP-binding protein, partial [Candidatus Deferrimicrobium sp.]|nr:AMP-binding protein [Candidatus Deferrimicrobium sp.]
MPQNIAVITMNKKEGLDMLHEEYWLKKLAGNIEKKNFPYDHKAPVMDERRIERNTDKFLGEVFDGLLQFSRNSDLLLYKILVSGVVLLLHKYTGDGDGDIIVGGPVQQGKVETLNTVLALKNSISKNATFKEFFFQVGQTIDEAYANKDYPMAALLWQLNLLSAEDEFPLFDVTISLENLHDQSYLQYINTNMKFSFLSTGEYMEGSIEYNAAVYEKNTIKRIFHHLVNLLRVSMSNMDIPLTAIDILSAEDKKQLLLEFNDTKTAYPNDKSIPDVFAGQVEKEPDTIAAIYRDSYLSYKELGRKAKQVATLLRTKGIRRDEPVGIMAERSLEMVVGLLGILEAGGAYLPINIDYPEERKEYILKNANIRVLFTSAHETVNYSYVPEILALEFTPILNQGEPFERISRYYDSAYIIYTSGSTGKPKGVIVEHRGVIRLVKNTDYLTFNERERILQMGALEFDASTFEIWGSLLNGLVLCLAHNDDILIPENLKQTLLKYDIDTILMTTSLFNQMTDVDSRIFSSLDYLLIGGEALSPAHINQVRSTCRHLKIINCYGPTENTTFSTTFTIDRNYEENIPIGRPMANSTCHIVDENLHLLPLGVPGELVVGGDGVARGYLNAPE